MKRKKGAFHACYREPGPLPRKACDHALYPCDEKDSGCQFARIDKYLFGLTETGLDMFKCFLETPEDLVSKYGWKKEVTREILDGADWTGERLSFEEAMRRMEALADTVVRYPDGSVLFVFTRKKVDFNVEIYSTEGLDFLEGFLIASIDSGNYQDFFSLIINEMNIIEIECDYGLNEPPDDNPWNIRYDGLKLAFNGHEIHPS